MEILVNEEAGDLVIVALKGDIDLEHSGKVREALLEAVGPARGVIVDMSGVTMIDSSGVASLLEAFQTARKRGKDFILAAAGDPVMRVLKLARLDTVFQITTDVAEAKQEMA